MVRIGCSIIAAAAAAATTKDYTSHHATSGRHPYPRIDAIFSLGARPSDGVIRLSCADRLLLPCQTLLSVAGLVPKSAWLLLASCYLCPLHHHRRHSSYCPDIFCLLRTQTSVEYLCSL